MLKYSKITVCITYGLVSIQCAAVIAYLSLMITFVHTLESTLSCCGTISSLGFSNPAISPFCLSSPHAAID